MGLVFRTSKWMDLLWTDHLKASKRGRDLVAEGVRKQGRSFAGVGVDLTARLYLPTSPPVTGKGPAWAVELHEMAVELSEWERLRVMCGRNGFATGIAAEVLLEHLLPHVPERPLVPQDSASQDGAPSEEPAGRPDEPVPGTTDLSRDGSEQGQLPDRAELRAAMRRAARAAREAVDQAESELDGMTTPLGFSAGTTTPGVRGHADLKAIRESHDILQRSPRLRRISKLAGRIERLACAKARSRVRPGTGEVHGVGLGSDLARLLPSELAHLRHPALRRLLLARLAEHRALMYSMEGREPQARGPILVLLDESGSMAEDGRDVWSKAVALALLATATRQKRAWHLVGFDAAITRELEITGGRASAGDIQKALDHGCGGGTDFSAPVLRAIDIIEHSPTMRQADVVCITDGEDELTLDAIEAARRLTRTEGVSWYVVGVGPQADLCLRTLGSIATEMVRVVSADDSDQVLDVINLETTKDRLWRG